jgi:RNA 3'-terminal phosphate cyclase
VNVTVTPDIGVLLESLTVACSAVANAVFSSALCGVPAVAVTLPVDVLSAAPLSVIFPQLGPEVIVQVTRNVCPGADARYVSV